MKEEIEDHMWRNRDTISAMMVNFSFEDENMNYLFLPCLLLHQKAATVEITPPE